ncbi:carbonyl reductase [NADPH] 1-like, partial [Thalassophryne amazonica]|uniref:carbonyl reductase [NADPH] 1-like n=1 Tax=Thalassophryne amazonica TaxID=390379 RepID=UPI001470B8FD
MAYCPLMKCDLGQKAMESLNSEGLKPNFHELDINDPDSCEASDADGKALYSQFICVVNISSMLGSQALNSCSPALQEHFRREDITEEELEGLMQRFVTLSMRQSGTN